MPEFNFNVLKTQIEQATKNAFIELFNKHKDEGIYAFALYSDEGAMTVCPSTNTRKHYERASPEDLWYYKFEPAEWKYEMQGANEEFNAISKIVATEVAKTDDNENRFLEFRKKLYDSCIEVLTKLKRENFFTTISGTDIFLTFSVSEYEFEQEEIKKIIQTLNSEQHQQEYFNWMKTWTK